MIEEQKSEQEYTGIILAGGQNSRMGKEKGLIHMDILWLEISFPDVVPWGESFLLLLNQRPLLTW